MLLSNCHYIRHHHPPRVGDGSQRRRRQRPGRNATRPFTATVNAARQHDLPCRSSNCLWQRDHCFSVFAYKETTTCTHWRKSKSFRAHEENFATAKGVVSAKINWRMHILPQRQQGGKNFFCPLIHLLEDNFLDGYFVRGICSDRTKR